MSAEFEEPMYSGLDEESTLLHAAAIVQREAKIIELRDLTIQASANSFEQSRRQYRKLGKEVDRATGEYDEIVHRRRLTAIKNTAISGVTTLGILATTGAVYNILVEPTIESLQHMQQWRIF